MKLFRTALGVDLSGSRIAVVAVRTAPGGLSVALPPLAHEFGGEREAARLEEAESILGEYVTHHGLVGAEAFLALPAERVHMGRASFPPMREKDLRDAVGLELGRLFPVSPDSLRYGYRKVPGPTEEGKVLLAVAAVSREYIELCGQLLSRAGMTLGAAVPPGWAAGAALYRILGRRPGQAGALSVLLRWRGDSVECTVLSGPVPLFCSSRPCTEEIAPEEGLSLALAGLTDALRDPEEPVDLYAPPGWFPEREFRHGPDDVSFRAMDGFPAGASVVLSGPGSAETPADPFPFLFAYGAVVGGREMDLLSFHRSVEVSRAMRMAVGVSAAAALLLGLAWPATTAWRAQADLRRLDRQVAELRPFAERHEISVAEIDGMRTKLSILQRDAAASGEPLRILKELTDRIPSGTWLSSLRVEGRTVELDGFSPSSSELFPTLTRDGRFRSVDWGAPITRQGENMERFKLRGEYVPPNATPSAAPPAASPVAPASPARGKKS